MNIALDQKDTANASIRVTLEEADYQPRVDKKLKEYGRTAALKGFRPGKVPAGLLRKMYGKGILVDEVNNLLAESVDSYIKENQLPIVGDPLPNTTEAESIDWENQREFTFSYDIGLVPDFSYDLAGLRLTRLQADITEQDLEAAIENMRNRQGTYSNPDEVGGQDLVMGTLTQPEGDFKKENAYLFINKLTEEAKPLFVGKKRGDEVDFDLQAVFQDAEAVRLFTQVPQEEAEKLAGTFRLAITDIDRQELAELNEEFFKKVYGEQVTTEAEFRERMRNEMERLFETESEKRLSTEIQEQLVANTHIALPDAFLHRWLKATNKNLSDEQIAKEYDGFLKGLKWTIIKDRIGRDHDLKVEHEEVVAQAKKSFKEVYGFLQKATAENDELLDKLSDNFLKAEKGKNYMNTFQRAFTDKVTAFVRTQLTPETKKVSVEEFNKAAED